jgi:hypothetical protein
MGAIDDPLVADGVDVVKERVQPALGHPALDLRFGETQRVQLRPADNAELSSRQAGQGRLSARVFGITMRPFTLAHEARVAAGPPLAGRL